MAQESKLLRTRTNPLSPEELAELNTPFTEAELESIRLKQSIKAGRLVFKADLAELSELADQLAERSRSRTAKPRQS